MFLSLVTPASAQTWSSGLYNLLQTLQAQLVHVQTQLAAVSATTNEPQTTTSISDYGITWYFAEPVEYGQYVTGDYWVKGPVTITNITPEAAEGHHGWEVNPDSSSQPYDDRIKGYNSSLQPSLPYNAAPGDSVVKTISLDLNDQGCRPCLKEASVLTVVAEEPPEDAFRPTYAGTDKELYRVSDLDLSLLPSVPVNEDLSGKLTELTQDFDRFWLDHRTGWSGRHMHPKDHMPDYGGHMAHRTGEVGVLLMMDFTEAEKLPLLTNYMQYAIDLEGMMRGANTTFPGDGGHMNGRKLPMAMGAVLFDDAEMQSLARNIEPGQWSESDMLYYSEKANNGEGMVLLGNTRKQYYYMRMTEGRGAKDSPDPFGYIDGGSSNNGANGGWGYLAGINVGLWKGPVVVMELMPEVKEVWNDPRITEVVQRYYHFGMWTQPDPCAPFDGNPDNYGVTYGTDPETGDCIKDTDPSDGVGRVPDKHGSCQNGANNCTYGFYSVNLADELWEEAFGSTYEPPTAEPLPVSEPEPEPEPTTDPAPTAKIINGESFRTEICADENDVCRFDGTRRIAYGANDSFVIETHTDEVHCTNSVFGDPLRGTRKACYVGAVVSSAPAPTPEEEFDPTATFNFKNLPITDFQPNVQDEGNHTISSDGTTLTLDNQAWQAVAVSVEVTTDTWLSFDFRAQGEGEIHGVMFTNGDALEENRGFNLFGTQDWGIQDYVHDGSASSQRMGIPVGEYFTGTFDTIVFFTDNDAGSGAKSVFANVVLSTDEPMADSFPETDPVPTPEEPETEDATAENPTEEIVEDDVVEEDPAEEEANDNVDPATDAAEESVPVRIQTTDNLNVRSTPNGTIIGTVSIGTAGTVLSDTPVQSGLYSWIEVQFDTGTTGYVASAFTTTLDTIPENSTRKALMLQMIALLQQLISLLQAQQVATAS